MPIPFAPRVQNSFVAGNPFPNYAYASTTDGHVIVIDKDNCVLYELFHVNWDGHALHAAVGAVFDLMAGDNQRPYMNTSASVSGLPLLPGFLRDEELNGTVPINHPIAVTLAVMAGSGNFFPKHSWIAPASHHQYGSGFNPWWAPGNIPVGALLRLKPAFDVSSYPAQAQIILAAMKKYGLIFVDGGNTVDFYAAAGFAWDASSTAYMYTTLSVLQDASNFDVVTSNNPVYCDPLYATAGYNGGNTPICPNSTGSLLGTAPSIGTLVGSRSGNVVTLSWTISGASTRLRWITPNVGTVLGNSVSFSAPASTTYTLMIQNQYGRVTRSVTI